MEPLCNILFSLGIIFPLPPLCSVPSSFCFVSEKRRHYINDIPVEVKKAMSKQDLAAKQEQINRRGGGGGGGGGRKFVYYCVGYNCAYIQY